MLGRRSLLAIPALAARETAAHASAFDACVLDHMKDGISDFAAKSIKAACVRTSEAPLPSSALDQLRIGIRAGYGPIYGYSPLRAGLHLTGNNTSGFAVTELTLTITRQGASSGERYTVRRFPALVAQGVIVTGPPIDPTIEMVIQPGLFAFSVPIAETAENTAQFGKLFKWDIDAPKGWPA